MAFKPLTAFAVISIPLFGQLVDQTSAPNPAREGIAKSLTEQIGAGRGDWSTPNSSSFVIARDPFRAIRRGRQLFQRKFQRLDGSNYLRNGFGDVAADNGIGAGSTDSCASCHGRPRGSAGFGGVVATRPDSRDAPHLFGLGLKEMLADEITAELRDWRRLAIVEATLSKGAVTKALTSKGISFGRITVRPDLSLDTSEVDGVDSDLRVRPFFHHGGTISIREFVVGALNAEMGFQSVDPELTAAAKGGIIVTPSGMTLDGKLDKLEAPPVTEARNQMATPIVDYLEFYLLNYFKPAVYMETAESKLGRSTLDSIGCTSCHVADLQIDRDRRVADVETVYDLERGNMNNLFATASALLVTSAADASGFPAVKTSSLQPFLVKNVFTDFKRHDLGPNFHERNYDGSTRTVMMTAALWGVGSTSPYGHDGRSINLHEVILRHGGEAKVSRDAYAALKSADQRNLQDFLQTLILFPPEDTASNLDPGDKSATGYPQVKHGSIRLTTLFNVTTDIE